MIFWKKATKFAGFLVVIFASQSKNLQQFLHSEKIWGILEDFMIFLSFHLEGIGWDWMGADEGADDRENYINKLPNSRSTAPRAPNISSR